MISDYSERISKEIKFEMFYSPEYPKSCNSLTLYLSSLLLRKLDANAIVCQTVSEHFSNTAPKQVRDASHFMKNPSVDYNVYFCLFFLLYF